MIVTSRRHDALTTRSTLAGARPCSRAYTRRPTASGSQGSATSSSSVSARSFLTEPNSLQQPRPAGRAEPGDVVEHRLRRLLGPQLAVVRDREPVGLVAHLLEQVQRLGVARDADRVGAAGPVDLLEALGQARHPDVLEPELLEHPHRDAELPLAAVDQQQVRRVREPLARARALVALVEVAAEAAGEHLFHRREVVLAFVVADLEAPVVGALRQAVLHHDHRRRRSRCPAGSRCRSTRCAAALRAGRARPAARSARGRGRCGRTRAAACAARTLPARCG